eukprot:Gregarina_sp_Poly_1__5626@NODE_296_length_9847_cov_43_256544_g256_i0_p6_GENE_NODE_296_length_9847_cov_43_256544_g256_i0NODE_296_length_9847_cov_43_256544_g256_i0_p6_ORF_typecomplete_len182_score26_57Mog1/PF04603_12/2_8e21_NODE_296_length_9847_cov_43_256544_g256_i040244569
MFFVPGASKSVQCFEGAITLNIPSDLLDESRVRPIPDNQEVFYNPQTRVSMLLDIVEMAEPTSESFQALHWNEIVRENRASMVQMKKDMPVDQKLCPGLFSHLSQHPKGAQFQVGFCEGNQRFENIESSLSIFVIRLPLIKTEIILQLNIPDKEPDENQSATFLHSLETLRIHDWNLFGSA